MDSISSVSPISPSNKVRHGPFGACSDIFRYKPFTKGCFLCIVHKLPSIFLVIWHTKLQLFLQWFRPRHLILCRTFVTRLVSLPMPKQNHSWHFLECFGIFAKREVEIKSMTHFCRRATSFTHSKLLNRAASYTCSKRAKHGNLKMQNSSTEYTDGNNVIYTLPKQPPSNGL